VRANPHFVRNPQSRAVVIAGEFASRERLANVTPRRAYSAKVDPGFATRIRAKGAQKDEMEDAMIPGQFNYHRPATLADAVKLLSTLGDEARPLAGGHSLVPMMKLRLATPEHLIDLHGIAGLKGIRRDGDNIVIGAMTTQHELLASDEIAKSIPILHEAALLIADPQVRYRGTIGGNVANGDPGNDLPALMMTLGASYRLEGANGARDVAATEFYQGAYFTSLEPGEILTSVSAPVPPVGHGFAYEKLKRKVGDYATAAAAVVLTMSGGKVATCAIGLTNLAETPLLAADAAKAVIGTGLDDAALKKAAAAAVAIMSPAADARGPVEYRKHVGGIMVMRALQRAARKAG
jgi:carbon-monoxide dehydrogenase medium subunit